MKPFAMLLRRHESRNVVLHRLTASRGWFSVKAACAIAGTGCAGRHDGGEGDVDKRAGSLEVLKAERESGTRAVSSPRRISFDQALRGGKHMPASVDEQLTESFRVTERALRDLDSIAQKSVAALNPTGAVRYRVTRAGRYEVDASDINAVVSERNGQSSRLTGISILIDGGPALKVEVVIEEGIRIFGSGVDDPSFEHLIQEIRALAQDSMKGRKARVLGLPWFFFIPLLVGLLCYVLYALLVIFPQEQEWATYNSKVEQYYKDRDAQEAAYANCAKGRSTEEAERERLGARRDLQVKDLAQQGAMLVKKGTIDERLRYLVKVLASEAQYSTDIDAITSTECKYPELSGFPRLDLTNRSDSWLWGLLPYISTALALGILVLVSRRPERVFLIGSGVERQAKAERIRDRWLWGVVATLILGIVSSVAATLILH